MKLVNAKTYHLLVLAIVPLLAGCLSSGKKLLNDPTAPKMSAVFTGSVSNTIPQKSKKPLSNRLSFDTSEYFRTHTNETENLFKRLPNPDLVVFVFPHFTSSSEKVPIPGYSTVIPMYGKIHYAMPGDRTKIY